MEWLPEIVVAVAIVVLLVIPHVVLRDSKVGTTKTSDKEICVIPKCGRETGYRKDTPTDRREHYVDGAGQLCDKCENEFLLDEYRKRKNALGSAFG